MKINIRPAFINTISFDLDDTLYDNRGYIQAAEQALLNFLALQFPRAKAWHSRDWLNLKQRLVKAKPLLGHDTTAARLATLEQGLLIAGYDKSQATAGAQQGLALFLDKRSDFTVPSEVLLQLKSLQSQYRLVGITNGNVDANRIGLGEVFEFVLHPGEGMRMKPYPDLFYKACRQLHISHKQLLHVGDSYTADVQGARRAGCQAAWLNPAVGREAITPQQGQLAHIEFSNIDQLQQLSGLG
ncbi:HAD-IA family hydrolase [Shewanella sp. Scap07]|uniref:HAD-IA family hydrolase n=1 Tax=Shewanella sp. Scap07 TaxID=2589987 RepID=UPI0015BF82FC|nr:HAD-IA family hydrolase [Shewanella sp. Scap07]QLE84024.1 HAD-IA family hydrolase [Shewanella sp. Scap07]